MIKVQDWESQKIHYVEQKQVSNTRICIIWKIKKVAIARWGETSIIFITASYGKYRSTAEYQLVCMNSSLLDRPQQLADADAKLLCLRRRGNLQE
jgi:hypothetical protein